MPDEVTRETNMLRIYDPHDQHTFVDVKVIRNIHFKDPSEGNQEYVYRFNNQQNGNGDDNHRITRLQEVIGTDHSSKVEVERIKVWGVTNPQDSNQQTGFRMLPDLSDNEPPVPFKYHDVKIHNPHKHDVWVVMRRRDYTHLLDPKAGPSNNDSAIPASGAVGTDQTGGWASQDKYFKLNWADDDEHNPDHEVDKGQHSTDVNGPHGPYRFDPFQDLIDVHWGHSHGHLPHHPTITGFCLFYPMVGSVGGQVAIDQDVIAGNDTELLRRHEGFCRDMFCCWCRAGITAASPGDVFTFGPGCPSTPVGDVPGPQGFTLNPVPDGPILGIGQGGGTPVAIVWLVRFSFCQICNFTGDRPGHIVTGLPMPPGGYDAENIYAAVQALTDNFAGPTTNP